MKMLRRGIKIGSTHNQERIAEDSIFSRLQTKDGEEIMATF